MDRQNGQSLCIKHSIPFADKTCYINYAGKTAKTVKYHFLLSLTAGQLPFDKWLQYTLASFLAPGVLSGVPISRMHKNWMVSARSYGQRVILHNSHKNVVESVIQPFFRERNKCTVYPLSGRSSR